VPSLTPDFMEWESASDYAEIPRSFTAWVQCRITDWSWSNPHGSDGFDNREPKPSELALMRKLVAQALEEGVFGLSTGLILPAWQLLEDA